MDGDQWDQNVLVVFLFVSSLRPVVLYGEAEPLIFHHKMELWCEKRSGPASTWFKVGH